MSDTKISALPTAAEPADADLLPIVQGAETRRATLAQLRAAALADRPLHVRDFGAVGDGVADDGPAFQAAIDALAAGRGGTLLLGPRHYRIASPVVVSGVAVTLQGAGFAESPSAGDGSWIVIDATGFTPFTFTGAGARGSVVRDLAVRQSHAAAQTAAWAPTGYDYVFRVVDCLGGVDFENLFLCAVNKGIYSSNSGRLNIQRLRGQVFTAGVEIDAGRDAARIHHVHFWTFWSSDDDVVRWTQQNGDALLLRRCDGVFLDDLFALGMRSMVRLAPSVTDTGATGKLYLGSAYADFVKWGVWVEANGVTGQIASLTTQSALFNGGGAALPGGGGLRIDGAGAQIQIGNLRVDAAESNAVRVGGTGNRLDIFAFRAQGFNALGDGAAAIHVADSGAGAANQVHLGSPPMLGGGGAGPLVNAATNGTLAMMAPPGRLARPGLMVGFNDTGLYAPAAGEVATVAGGAEVLRAAAGGTVTLGGAPGAHALGVTTPAGAVNELRVTGGAAGAAVSAAAQGADANVALRLSAKGSGTVQLQAGGALAFEAAAPAGAVNSLRANAAAAAGRVALAAQGADAEVGLDLWSKGTGSVALISAGARALFVSNPSGAVNHLSVQGGTAGAGPVVSVAGADANAHLNLSARGGTGAVQLRANGKNILRADDLNGNGDGNLLVRAGAGVVNLAAEGPPANVNLVLAAKGAGFVAAAMPVQLPTFTVAALPAAASYPRCILYVADGAGARRVAVSDGASWRWPDGGLVS